MTHKLQKNFTSEILTLLSSRTHNRFPNLGIWKRDWDGGFITKLCPTLETPWTVACQDPLSMGFSRQEYLSGLSFPSPGDLPNPGIRSGSPALQVDSLPTELWGKSLLIDKMIHYISECFNVSKIKKIKLDWKIINSIRIRYIYISKDFIKKTVLWIISKLAIN